MNCSIDTQIHLLANKPNKFCVYQDNQFGRMVAKQHDIYYTDRPCISRAEQSEIERMLL